MSSALSFRPLKPAASTPLWLQLKHALRDLITFELRPGDRIPSESELERHYRLSRITVRQAITSLVDEGLLHRQPGRGTFVLSARLAEPLAGSMHFLGSGFDGADLGAVSVYSRETVPVPDWIAVKLGLPSGEEVHKIRKVLLPEGGEPLAFRTTFIPRRLAPSLLEADLSRPMHAILERLYGFELREADETIEYIVADGFRSEILHLPEGHPLVLVERITYLNSGEAVDCSRAYYRADRFRFSRRLKRSEDGADASATTMQALPREDGAMGLAAAGIAA